MDFHSLLFVAPSLMAFIVGHLTGRRFAHRHPDDTERIEAAWTKIKAEMADFRE